MEVTKITQNCKSTIPPPKFFFKEEATKILSVVEEINRLWNVHRVEYYSARNINKQSSHEKNMKKKTLRCILIRERSQYEKAIYRMIPTV